MESHFHISLVFGLQGDLCSTDYLCASPVARMTAVWNTTYSWHSVAGICVAASAVHNTLDMEPTSLDHVTSCFLVSCLLFYVAAPPRFVLAP